ncbi:MAG: hypothetical protein ACEPOW_04005 [Bacteroidales bacterium]
MKKSIVFLFSFWLMVTVVFGQKEIRDYDYLPTEESSNRLSVHTTYIKFDEDRLVETSMNSVFGGIDNLYFDKINVASVFSTQSAIIFPIVNNENQFAVFYIDLCLPGFFDLGNLTFYELTIFDNWEQKLFTSFCPENDLNGSFNKKPIILGTYI